MNYEIDYFNKMAKQFNSDPDKIQRAKYFAEEVKRGVNITPDFIGLDYGGGTGLASFFLQSLMQKIVIADISPAMLSVAEERAKENNIQNLFPQQLDLTSAALPHDRFDIIFILMTLHHIEDISGMIKKFYALLQSPGYLCIGDLNKEEGVFHGKDFTGHHGFDWKELKDIVEAAGFQKIRFKEFFQVEKQMDAEKIRNFPLFFMVAEKRE